MSIHSYIRPLGVWNAGVPVLHQEFAALDAAQVDSVSSSGGAYAPSSPIYVDGAGMQIRLVGDNALNGSLTIEHGSGVEFQTSTVVSYNGQSLFLGVQEAYNGSTWTFDSGSNTTFSAGSFLTVNGSFNAARLDAGIVDVSGALVVEVGGSTSLGGGLTVSGGPIFFHGDTHFYGTNYFHFETNYFENHTIASNITVDGWMESRGDFTLIGAGTFVERVVIGAGANGTYSVSTADLVFIPASTAPGGYTYHVDAVGAVEGKRMRFCLEQDIGAGTTVQLINNLGTQIGDTILRNNSTGYTSMEIMFIAGSWRLISFCKAFLV